MEFGPTVPTPFKIAAVLLIAGAAVVHLLHVGYADWHAGADTAYVMALLLLFFGREKSNDERVQSLKVQALFVAFATGWALTSAVRFAFYLRDRSVPPPTLSSFDVMFLMLLIAHVLFQFWRWRDGRDSAVA